VFDEECFPGNEEYAIPFELKMRNDKNKAESKNRKEMNSTSDAVRAQQTRTRALIVPREHGAWGLLLVPLFTGVVQGLVRSTGSGRYSCSQWPRCRCFGCGHRSKT